MFIDGGTVQKKSVRAKQFFFTQHERNFHASLAPFASACATKSSIGERAISSRKDFLVNEFRSVDCAMRGAR